MQGALRRIGTELLIFVFQSTDLDCSEFFAQQPRWNIHKRDTPWCVYMTHSLASNSTTYVVVCSKMQSCNEVVKERLMDVFRPPKDPAHKLDVLLPDPFLLHLIITHEAFLEAKSVITETRYKLYDALDSVDSFSQQSSSQRSKEELEHLTIQLHVVSQDTDSMSASADMAAMILRRLADAHRRYAGSVQGNEKKDSMMKTTDAINYLTTSIESQMRWLNSYKSRKDIAMNLVSMPAHTIKGGNNVTNLSLQSCNTTRRCYEYYYRSRSQGRWHFHEGDCSSDNDLPTWDMFVVGIWDGCAGACEVVAVRRTDATFDYTGRSCLVALGYIPGEFLGYEQEKVKHQDQGRHKQWTSTKSQISGQCGLTS